MKKHDKNKCPSWVDGECLHLARNSKRCAKVAHACPWFAKDKRFMRRER